MFFFIVIVLVYVIVFIAENKAVKYILDRIKQLDHDHIICREQVFYWYYMDQRSNRNDIVLRSRDKGVDNTASDLITFLESAGRDKCLERYSEFLFHLVINVIKMESQTGGKQFACYRFPNISYSK